MTQSIFPVSSGLKKIIRGMSNVASVATHMDVTITAVDLAKSETRFLGWTNGTSDYRRYETGGGAGWLTAAEAYMGGMARLTTSTKVTIMTRGSVGEVAYEVTEWQ